MREDLQIESLLERASAGDVAGVLELLDRGIDVNASNLIDHTALMSAVAHGHVELIKILLGRGASLDARNSLDFSPLTYAVIRSRSWDACWITRRQTLGRSSCCSRQELGTSFEKR